MDLEPEADLRATVQRALGSPIDRWEPARWGFATPTARIELASGERLIIQRRSTAEAHRVLDATRLLVGAGIPVAPVVMVIERSDGAILVQREVAGASAAAAIGTVEGPAMAAGMGALSRRIAAVAGGPVDPTWASPGGLRDAAPGWLAPLDRATSTAVNSSVDRVGRGAWPVGLSHGDFAPVNGLIDDGRVAAVIDLAEVARRHRLVDPAWWLLVVRHHHPDAARVLSERFLATAFAGVTRPAPDELAGVAVARAAQRLSMARLDGRAHAGALLRAALEWAAEARSRGRADRHSLSPPETV